MTNKVTTVSEKIAAGVYKTKLPFVYRSKDVKGWQAYQADKAKLELQLQADLEEEYGLTGHPKAQTLFDLAWSHGHSAGHSAVANYYDEFYVLLT